MVMRLIDHWIRAVLPFIRYDHSQLPVNRLECLQAIYSNNTQQGVIKVTGLLKNVRNTMKCKTGRGILFKKLKSVIEDLCRAGEILVIMAKC